MSPKTVKQLIRYRSILVASVNGIITWIILIIAPLGLFAVIICTLLVIIASFIISILGDNLLFNLLRQNNIKLFTKIVNSEILQQENEITHTKLPDTLEEKKPKS